MRFTHSILICLAGAMLSSCSRVKLAYNYGDWLLQMQAHKFLDLNSEADKKLEAEIDAYHAWHRKEMLPRYAALARRLAKGFRGEENPEDNMKVMMPLLNQAWQETLEPAYAPLAEAMASLDERGLKYLETSYAVDNAKQRKHYLKDPEAAKKRRVKRNLTYVADFAGELSEEQKKKIAEIVLSTRVPSGAWIENRERRQGQLMALLKGKKDKGEIVALLRDWWTNSRLDEKGKDEAKMDSAEVRVFFMRLLEVLTPEQRERGAKKMEDYALKFEELAAK